MSGAPINTTLTLSAELREAATAASAAALRRRTIAVHRAVTDTLARTDTTAADRQAVLLARAEVLATEARRVDDAHAAQVAEAARAATVSRTTEELGVAEAALDGAERTITARIANEVVREVVVRRVVDHLPPSLRPAVSAIRPAPSGALRVDALRATGERVGLELDVDLEAGVAPLTLDVEQAGLHGASGSHNERCAQELRAAEQLVERLAAAGLAPGRLRRDDERTRASRRARSHAGKARGGAAR